MDLASLHVELDQLGLVLLVEQIFCVEALAGEVNAFVFCPSSASSGFQFYDLVAQLVL